MKIKWFALTTLALIFGLFVGVSHFSISASASTIVTDSTSFSVDVGSNISVTVNGHDFSNYLVRVGVFYYSGDGHTNLGFVTNDGNYRCSASVYDNGTWTSLGSDYSIRQINGLYYYSFNITSYYSSSYCDLTYFGSLDDFLNNINGSVPISTEDFNFINPRLFGGRTSAYTLTTVNFFASDTLSNGDTLSGIAYYFGTDLSSSDFTTTTGNFLHLSFPTSFSSTNVYLYVVPINSDGVYGNGIKYTFNTSSENISATGTHISVSDTDYPVCTTTTVTTDGFEYNDPDTSTSSGTTELNNIIDIPSSEELAEILIGIISTFLNDSQATDISDSDYDVPNSIDSSYDYNITSSDNVTITETDIDDLGLTDTMQDFSDGLTAVIQNDIFRPYFQLLGINTFNAWPIYLGLPSFFLILLVLKIFIFR